MKMTVETARLLKALRQVEGAVQEKGSIMATSGILFAFDKTFSKLLATDLENTIVTEVICEAEGRGEFVINGKKLVALVSKIGSEKIVFEQLASKSGIVITADGLKYEFLTMNPEEFPRIPAVEKGVELQLKAEEVVDCLKSVSFCVDSEEPRPHFRGVLVDLQPDGVYFVGTDTKQLAVNCIKMKNEKTQKILLPIKTVSILQKSMESGDMEIHLSKNSVFLKQGVLGITAQLLSGVEDYPNYDKVIPDRKNLELAQISVKSLREALNRISVFLTERYRKILFRFEGGKLLLEHINPEIGEGKEELAVEFSSEPITVALNSTIIDYINKVTDESLTVGVKDSKLPLLFYGKNEDKKFITMPLKLD